MFSICLPSTMLKAQHEQGSLKPSQKHTAWPFSSCPHLTTILTVSPRNVCDKGQAFLPADEAAEAPRRFVQSHGQVWSSGPSFSITIVRGLLGSEDT